MSSRAMKMVELAKRIKTKENIQGSDGLIDEEENIGNYIDSGKGTRYLDLGKTYETKTNNCQENSKNQTPTEQCSSNESFINDLVPNFTPIISNETHSSMNGHNIDIELLQDELQHSENIENDFDIEGNLFDVPEWINSDDSLSDPDFILSESDEDMSVLGAQIEAALATPKCKNKKKLRTELRNGGKSYISVAEKTVKARVCKEFDVCRYKCNEKIEFEKVQLLFDKYWSMGSYNQRILYIGSLIRVEGKKCDTLVNAVNRKRTRNHTMKYTLEVDGNIFFVCKKHFLYCFDESESFIKSVIQKQIGCPSISFDDKRGKHTPANKYGADVEAEIRSHISRFPAYESHYSRRDTCQKYLPSSLNLTNMHRLYKSEHSTPVSLSKYSQIFKTMGLKFKAPKVDTCSTCDTFVSKIKVAESEDEKFTLIESKENHLDKAEKAYEAKRNDKKEALQSKNVKTFAFDLQQCLPTPFLSFYKRQLWTFNLTVHDLETNKAKCFMWHEAMARRGGNEISSCIYKLLKVLPDETKKVTLYSDSCAGQNKNSFVASMFIVFLQNSVNIDTIDHKFLEPGHTHMECDSDHALIERMKKKTNVQIETPRDWYQFVNSVGNKMEVIEMKGDDFYDFGKFSKSKFSWKRIDEDGNKFTWNSVRWLRYSKKCNQVSYKNSLDEDEKFKILKVGKRGVSLNVNDISIVTDLPEISKEKKKDLMDLKQFISPEFHSFYENLASNMDERNTHPDLTDPDNSEDI